jgi:hypothetical protein
MTIKERSGLVKNISILNSAWSSVKFKKYESLYYKKDIDTASDGEVLYTEKDGNDVQSEEFAIGPATGREWMDYGKMNVNFDRGPCN